MAREPLVKEQIIPSKLVLNVENVGLTEEQFFRLCSDNRDLFMELTAQKELIIMPPVGLNSAWRENILTTRLTNWAEKDGTGIVCSPSALFKLENGAFRGPDASWIRKEKLKVFTKEELEKFGHLCPDFAAEVMSPSNTLPELQGKMSEYIANGALLGWLIAVVLRSPATLGRAMRGGNSSGVAGAMFAEAGPPGRPRGTIMTVTDLKLSYAVRATPAQLWRAVLRRSGGALALVATYPEDPAQN